MKLSDLMAGRTVDPSFEGLLTVDDYVLAIDTHPDAEPSTAIVNYAVLQRGVTGTPANVNPEEQTKQFIRGGKQTIVTSKQFTVSVSGTRYIGDEAQDYLMSFNKLFGIGSDLVTNYVYFNIKTGKGWRGTCTISVSSIADGNAGDDAGFSCDLKQTDANPVEFNWSNQAAYVTGLVASGSWTNTQHAETAVDPTGLIFTAQYSDGSDANVTSQVVLTPTTWGSETGTQNLVVTYTEGGRTVSTYVAATVVA